MEFFDRLTLDAPRRTGDGYLVASVRAARTGIQVYGGREVDPDNEHGMRDRATVSVYRPADEVFNADSLASYAHRPVTIEHPSERVTADNWSKYAVGVVDGEVVRDGEFVRVSMMVMDSEAIDIIDKGKREISQGYACDVEFTAGTTPEGLSYDAVQRNIRANHTAIVGVARGGHALRIGDGKAMKSILVDGHMVEVSDAAEIAIKSLQTKLDQADAALKTAQTTIGTHVATIATKDGELVAVKQQLADAQMTPAKLDAAVTERAKVVTDAKKIFPAVVVDGKSADDIRKDAVTHKLGDAAKSMDANSIMGAFTAFAASVGDKGPDTFADAYRSTTVDAAALTDGEKRVAEARASMVAHITNPGATKAA